MGIDPGEEAGAGRPADRDVAVGLGEGYAASAEAGDIGCPSLGVTAEALDVIVQVIADDEDDIGPLVLSAERRAREPGQQQECCCGQGGESSN